MLRSAGANSRPHTRGEHGAGRDGGKCAVPAAPNNVRITAIQAPACVHPWAPVATGLRGPPLTAPASCCSARLVTARRAPPPTGSRLPASARQSVRARGITLFASLTRQPGRTRPAQLFSKRCFRHHASSHRVAQTGCCIVEQKQTRILRNLFFFLLLVSRPNRLERLAKSR
jgi:hypothetical protein